METKQENVIPTDYAEVMQKSYIDYAMSVIISRALPDVRDGLKPVQRRTLYDMYELGIRYDRPYRKCARIVGDTMGKYHPHGDSSIYEALVVMAQDFKKGKTLVDGHGNFGSIEGDGAAAMRYTEARLEKLTQDVFLEDLDKNVVDFMPNFDETEKEPVVLPVRIPNLLVNGADGIAVGMATSIPPHNLGEVVDAVKAYMKNNDISVKGLMRYLKGPDFPTGGIVTNQDELLSAEEIAAVTAMDASGKGIADMTGVEYFTALETLSCGDNPALKRLSVISLSQLKTLRCANAALTALFLPRSSSLETLDCSKNQLTALNLNGCETLNSLNCAENQLPELSLSGLSALQELDCHGNQLTSLDLSGRQLTRLDCSRNQLTSLDVSKQLSLEELSCGENQLIALDVTGLSQLQTLSADGNRRNVPVNAVCQLDLTTLADGFARICSETAGRMPCVTARC